MANSIQYPGNKIPGSVGNVTVYVSPLAVAVSGTRRWSVLIVCVADPYRIMENVEATFVVMVNLAPGFSEAALTEEITGRVALVPSALKR